jgi:hypothetical protein
MSLQQLDLFSTKAPKISALEVETMKTALRGRDWQTAADLGAHSEGEKRRLRAVAEASKAEIISGPRGYRLTREVSHTEFHRCRARLLSFVKGTQERIRELDLVWHRCPQSRGDANSAGLQAAFPPTAGTEKQAVPPFR